MRFLQSNSKMENRIWNLYECGNQCFYFLSIVGRLEEIINTIRQISGHINMDTSYIATLIKMLGVTYIAEFASGICRDTGYQTIASQIEIFGKLTILVMSLPVLLALLQTIQEFLS